MRSRFFVASAEKRVDVGRVISADLVAGEHDEVGMRFVDGGFDEPNRVFAHVRAILDIGQLQHAEAAVAVETQCHDAHCNAANLDMG